MHCSDVTLDFLQLFFKGSLHLFHFFHQLFLALSEDIFHRPQDFGLTTCGSFRDVSYTVSSSSRSTILPISILPCCSLSLLLKSVTVFRHRTSNGCAILCHIRQEGDPSLPIAPCPQLSQDVLITHPGYKGRIKVLSLPLTISFVGTDCIVDLSQCFTIVNPFLSWLLSSCHQSSHQLILQPYWGITSGQ